MKALENHTSNSPVKSTLGQLAKLGVAIVALPIVATLLLAAIPAIFILILVLSMLPNARKSVVVNVSKQFGRARKKADYADDDVLDVEAKEIDDEAKEG